MSDVEKICERNHDRRKWAEEYEYADFECGEIATVATLPRNDKRSDRKRNKVLRTVCTACTMATGGAAAFVGIGLCMGHLLTVVVGSLVAATFLICGTHLESEFYREGRRANG